MCIHTWKRTQAYRMRGVRADVKRNFNCRYAGPQLFTRVVMFMFSFMPLPVARLRLTHTQTRLLAGKQAATVAREKTQSKRDEAKTRAKANPRLLLLRSSKECRTRESVCVCACVRDQGCAVRRFVAETGRPAICLCLFRNFVSMAPLVTHSKNLLLFSLFTAETTQHCCKLTFVYLCVYLRDGPQRVCWPKPDDDGDADATAVVAAFGCSQRQKPRSCAVAVCSAQAKKKNRKISVTSASKNKLRLKSKSIQ